MERRKYKEKNEGGFDSHLTLVPFASRNGIAIFKGNLILQTCIENLYRPVYVETVEYSLIFHIQDPRILESKELTWILAYTSVAI